MRGKNPKPLTDAVDNGGDDDNYSAISECKGDEVVGVGECSIHPLMTAIMANSRPVSTSSHNLPTISPYLAKNNKNKADCEGHNTCLSRWRQAWKSLDEPDPNDCASLTITEHAISNPSTNLRLLK
ncbi:hypothetical protein RRG08_048997 [Elysia crispata]|uniref:Uncharacterized protein n=1 Tax=Elysia crispata TaxID=231223 RepID=A0AAE0YCA3_9GAST|nr:hypothetical protein RRG08_048997 [Elysia crispata]